MSSTTSTNRKESSSHYISASHSSLKLKTYACAIATIIALSGLAIGAVGLAGYFRLGALREMTPFDPVAMMITGGGTFIVLTAAHYCSKQAPPLAHRKREQKETEPGHSPIPTPAPPPAPKPPPVTTTETVDEIVTYPPDPPSVYGRQTWRDLYPNIEILDDIPAPPDIDFDKERKALLYIPRRMLYQNEEIDFIKAFQQEIFTNRESVTFVISDDPRLNAHIDKTVKKMWQTVHRSGWILIDTVVDDSSCRRGYKSQQSWAQQRGGRMPTLLEGILICKMVSQKKASPDNFCILCSDQIPAFQRFGPYCFSVNFSRPDKFEFLHLDNTNRFWGTLCVIDC